VSESVPYGPEDGNPLLRAVLLWDLSGKKGPGLLRALSGKANTVSDAPRDNISSRFEIILMAFPKK
jgi:hypothetical protein